MTGVRLGSGMVSCDVVVVGGGPAGSTCAWRLRQAGADVVVVDRATFPRDKVCAGWITPPVVDALCLDVDDYRHGRTFEAICGFSIGMIGRTRSIKAAYGHPVSFAIRRCEFDDYLLKRSGARLLLGTAVTSTRRAAGAWIVNDTIRAPMLVGAGGHFCPVARWLNQGEQPRREAPLVVAQEAEWALCGRQSRGDADDLPQLFFCRDLKGYGWCVRKGGFVNVGLGRVDPHALHGALEEFVAFLVDRGALHAAAPRRWNGHAYLLADRRHRRVVGDAVLLAGDAAGLADSRSGEGIRQAIESGLATASAVVDAGGQYTRDRLESYEARLFRAAPSTDGLAARAAASSVAQALGRTLLLVPPFVRHVVIERWFLQRVPLPSRA